MGMTKTEMFKTLDRTPMVGDIVIITPRSEKAFEVIELDALYEGEFIRVDPIDPADDRPAFWTSSRYVRVIDDEPIFH